MVRVVFDTVVFVRGLLNYRSRWARLLFESSPSYRLFVSQPILVEILEVLQRPEITSRFRTVADRDFRRVLEILSQAEVVEPPASRDVKDDKFLAAAVAAQAEYLVSEDRDLLDLKAYQGIPIVDAETFLKMLEDPTL